MKSYFQFNRHQWATFRDSIPIILTQNDIDRIKGINKNLSLNEVIEIYLPLSRLLNFYYSFNLRYQTVLENFIGINNRHIPYIISIVGSVAVGKSTTARILQILLSLWPEHRRVELITTDGFLYSNQILKERNLMKKKGFPQSYDTHRLVQFVSDLKSGVPNIVAPIYSHLIYDILPEKSKNIKQPDILILEGLNILQKNIYNSCSARQIFISDFVDFSIYIDAPEDLIKDWYVNRFLKFYEKAFTETSSYFRKYISLTKEEVTSVATSLWKEINYINLKENILPTREHAALILIKSKNHVVNQVKINKNIIFYNHKISY